MPELILLDETGEMLGVPGIVTQFVEGPQAANQWNTVERIEALAQMLRRVHDIRPSDRNWTDLFDANQQVLFFLRGERPWLSGGHPLSEDIFQVVR